MFHFDRPYMEEDPNLDFHALYKEDEPDLDVISYIIR
jgi:hypothetical protein